MKFGVGMDISGLIRNNFMLPLFTNYAIKAIDDGKYVDKRNLEGYTFPGYLVHSEFPLIPLNVDTNQCVDDLRHHDGRAIEILWCMGDDEQLFNKNLIKMGSSWHYSHKKVTYRLNRNGYRAPEWTTIDWKNAVVLLGCSMTFGVGVAEDETISYYLQNMLGRPVINIGYPAGSNETIFNNSVAIFEKFGAPAAVITAWSTTDRFKFYSSYAHDIGLWTPEGCTDEGINLHELYNQINLNVTNSHVKSYYLEKANKALWKDRSEYYTFSFFESSAHMMRLDTCFKCINDARDLVHPGKTQNLDIAKHLYTTLKDRI